MPTLTFEGETHDELVHKVRRWLESIEGEAHQLTVAEAVERASELTKDALAVIAESAPGPLSRNEVFKALTRMGYEVTDSTRRAVIAGLDTLSSQDASAGPGPASRAGSGETLVRRIERARNSVLYEMNAAVAKQVLRTLTKGAP